MKKRPSQVEEKQTLEENKEWAGAGVPGSCRQTFNFVLSWEHGSLCYLWSLSGGRRAGKKGGPALWVEIGKLWGQGSSCGTRVPRDATDQTHRHRATGEYPEREWERRGAAGQRGGLGKQRPLYGSRGKVLAILEYAQRVSVYWFSLLAGAGRSQESRVTG